MRTLRVPMLIAAGCLVPLIAHVASAQGDPTAPVPPAASAGSTAAPVAPTAPSSTSTEAPAAATDTTAPAAPPAPTEAAAAAPPAPTAPAAAAPATTQPSASTPAPLTPAAAPNADKAESKKPPERTLSIEGNVAGAVRLGSLSSGYESASRSGLMYGGGLYFAPDRHWAIGLSYEYSLATREHLNPTSNVTIANIDRTLQTVALNLRAYPIRSDKIGLYANLMLGASWQTADGTGAYVDNTFPASPAKTYSTSGGPQTGLALGAGLGMDLDLSKDVAMLTSVNFTQHRLSSDQLSGATQPLPGIGSTSELDFRVAFQYRFDLSGKSSAAQVTTARR